MKLSDACLDRSEGGEHWRLGLVSTSWNFTD